MCGKTRMLYLDTGIFFKIQLKYLYWYVHEETETINREQTDG